MWKIAFCVFAYLSVTTAIPSYFVIARKMTYCQAEAACARSSGHLAVIRNSAELNAAKQQIGQKKVWIGMTDNKREGQWLWLGRTPVDLRWNWARGQPDNWNKGEHCGESNGLNHYRFNDCNCSKRLDVLCQAKYANSSNDVGLLAAAVIILVILLSIVGILVIVLTFLRQLP